MNCEHLKVGDKVSIVHSAYGRSSVKIATVEKINKATIQSDGILFFKKNGRERGGDKYHPLFVESYENGLDIIAKNKEQHTLDKINKAISDLKLESTPELVEDLKRILEKYQTKKTP